MIRTFTLLIFTLITFVGFTQDKFSFVIKGQVFNTDSDTLYFYQNKGSGNEEVATIELDNEGSFERSIALKDKDYYVLGINENKGINIIVENENDTISVYGDGRQLFYHSNIVGSPSSKALLEFLRVNAQFQQKLDSANRYLQANTDKKAEIQKEFQTTYQTYIRQRDQFIKNNSQSPALVGALSAINFDQEFELYKQVVEELEAGFNESPTIQRLIKEFEVNKKKMQAQNPFASGNKVEDIALPNPEGDTLRLSDLEGKVVLIDFWAAWCGPCRRENPNVVNLYKKYHDQGFEVFSISLDKTIDKWTQAIEQDGLIWDTHVSDLKGWRSSAAQAYGVSSIPFTVLIDREGKVIGTKLRGEGLANKLQSIFE